MMTSVNRTMAGRGGNKHNAAGTGENSGGGSNALKLAMKQNNKLFRIGTVISYIVAVCSGAAVLAIYYSFFWDPPYGQSSSGPLTTPIATTAATSHSVSHTSTNNTIASSTGKP